MIITDFNVLKNGDTLALIKEYWENCSTGLDMRHRPHFHINETALASLFPEIDANSESLTSMIDILLHVPEEEILMFLHRHILLLRLKIQTYIPS
ncbi:hypothetical protein GTU79_14210 [Sodalis ligni]|uniref:hypothetical protein n=1 Tax=Sodalis ligni TaxID=2697027 RepID=UPI001BDF162F|nr:hypothetical protein [Sodalis ligni]QWA13620.1 hypothetical protein GTU79_14210 [Sodalis ligni]